MKMEYQRPPKPKAERLEISQGLEAQGPIPLIRFQATTESAG